MAEPVARVARVGEAGPPLCYLKVDPTNRRDLASVRLTHGIHMSASPGPLVSVLDKFLL